MDPAVLTFLTVLAGLLFFFLMMGVRDNRKKAAAYLRTLKQHDGQLPWKEHTTESDTHLSGYFHAHPAPFQIDERTAADLDLVSVFRRLDYTQSAAGEEYLYWLLRTPALQDEDQTLREEQIQAMQVCKTDRIALQIALHQIGGCGKYSIYDHLSLLDQAKRKHPVSNYLAILLIALSVVVLLFQTEAGIVLLFVSIAWNVITYYRDRNQVAPYLLSLHYILRLMDGADRLRTIHLSDTPCFEEEREELGKIVAQTGGFRRGSFLLAGTGRMAGGNPLDILFDYIRILLHLDLIKFNSMIDQAIRYRSDIDRLITIIGKIDSTISIACYRDSLGTWCQPNLGGTAFETRELVHPLLRSPVANSITTDGYVLLTGSNASGKSTFLRAAALAVLMAQTIRTVCAASYRAGYYRIYSSMALQDDLSSGESYYIVEIRSLKRILDAGKESSTPVLCFLDEVLRGTNTVERIAASSEILHSLRERGIRCFAATHDVELTVLLEKDYDNYHFEEQIQNGDISFPYRLLPGPARSRNAIRLLEAIGYDESIIQAAENRADNFLKTGTWK